jgi:hypothetical protein
MGTGGTSDAAVATSGHNTVTSAVGRSGSLATAALSTLDALDERRLVGMDVPDLSTLAGARSGMVGAALRTRRQEIELQPLETRTSEGATAYLKVEKPRFLFLESSMDAMVAAGVATAVLPDASMACAGASVARDASSIDRPAARPPQALVPLAPLRLLVRGAQAPTSQRGLPPVTLFFFSLS